MRYGADLRQSERRFRWARFDMDVVTGIAIVVIARRDGALIPTPPLDSRFRENDEEGGRKGEAGGRRVLGGGQAPALHFALRTCFAVY